MSDEGKLSDDVLIAGLQRLPQEIPARGELWSSIAETIREEPIGRNLSRLGTDAEPASDLWPAIEARIRANQGQDTGTTRKSRRTATLLAACLALLAVGFLFVQGLQQPGEGPASYPDLPRFAEDGFSDPAVETLFSELENSPSGNAGGVYRDHISMVRNQRATIEDAMQQYPNDTALRTLWRHTYETELRLIDEAEHVLTNI